MLFVKKLSIIAALALLLCLAFASQAMAAPSISVSAKYQGITNFSTHVLIPQIEVGVVLSPEFSLIFQGGPLVTPAPTITIGTVAAGIRYYFTPEGWRPFATLYACSWFDWTGVIFFPMGTVGLEYLSENGFRATAEVGGMYEQGTALFTYALAVGYAF